MKPNKWIFYAEENADGVWKDFNMATEIGRGRNGDEVYNVNNNNVQDDGGKKDNQDNKQRRPRPQIHRI
uniref:Uncharacterized protein n=1 Tax=Hyaloperonospora arabidopsidis (strain Emoy2) TaxID=559515 RepID=M4BBN8_HYAAE